MQIDHINTYILHNKKRICKPKIAKKMVFGTKILNDNKAGYVYFGKNPQKGLVSGRKKTL